MLVRQSAADHVVSGDFQDRRLELRIARGKAGVACVSIDRRLAVAHAGPRNSRAGWSASGVSVDGGNRELRVRHQQAKSIEVFELLPRPCGGCHYSDQMLFANEALAFQAGSAPRGSGVWDTPKFASEGHRSEWRGTSANIEGHQPVIDAVINAFRPTLVGRIPAPLLVLSAATATAFSDCLLTYDVLLQITYRMSNTISYMI